MEKRPLGGEGPKLGKGGPINCIMVQADVKRGESERPLRLPRGLWVTEIVRRDGARGRPSPLPSGWTGERTERTRRDKESCSVSERGSSVNCRGLENLTTANANGGPRASC